MGLMDRLSSYAAREAESVDDETRRQREEEAVAKLLEKIKVSDEAEKQQAEGPADGHENGTAKATEEDADEATDSVEKQPETATGEGPETKANIPGDVRLYDIFYDQVVNLVKTRGLPIQDTMALLVSLVNLALNIYPDRLGAQDELDVLSVRWIMLIENAEYVDKILGFATERTAEYAGHADLHSAPTQQNLLQLLEAPIRSYASIFTALALPHYVPLLSSQSYSTRRSVAGEVARSLLKHKMPINSAEDLDRVLQTVKVLIRDGMQPAVGYPGIQAQRRGGETDETIEEQGWLARLVHLIRAPDNDTQLKVRYKKHPVSIFRRWANHQYIASPSNSKGVH